MRRFGLAVLWTAFIGCLILLVLFAVTRVVPWKTETSCRCPYCGARAIKVTTLFIPMPIQVKEGPLSEYWRRSVDAHHEHEWVPFVRRFHHSRGVGVADYCTGSPGRWLLTDEELVAILSGLPTPAERKAFMDWLWESGQGKDARRMADTALWLRAVNADNPGRNDWPSVLRKHGFQPAIGSRSP